MKAELRSDALMARPVLPTLLRLAWPNVLSLLAVVGVTLGEAAYVGRLGVAALAGMALTVPFAVLQVSLSNGAMGGGVASAISRAIGAGQAQRAGVLALHGVVIATALGLMCMVTMLIFGPQIYRGLGATEESLVEALRYSNVLFLGAVPIWLGNTLVAVVRGTGNIQLAARAMIMASAVQLTLGAALCLGMGPIPRLGMRGVALGQVIAYSAVTLVLLYGMRSEGRLGLHLRWEASTLKWAMFKDILKVGSVSCIGPLQTNLTIIAMTGAIAHFGTAILGGYGIAARLEMLLVNIAFGVGAAAVPMVGLAVGHGNVARARQVAWTAGGTGAVLLGFIGLAAALWPGTWSGLFTSDVQVRAAAEALLARSGITYGFFGLGLCLFFASQGAGRVLGTVLAGTLRLFVVLGGVAYLASTHAPIESYFSLVALSMTVYGLAAAIAVRATKWGPRTSMQARN